MERSPAGERPVVDGTLADFAASIAREAGELTLKWFDTPDLTVDRKDDGSPVTVADREAEGLLRDRILSKFPKDSIVGEEGEDVEGSSGRTWVLDPIDGTESFIRGVPLYGTLVALADGHGPAVGVISLPALGENVWAGRGLGCFSNGQVARVSNCSDLSRACVVTSGVDYWPSTSLLERLGEGGSTIRTWGDAYGYALVATGRADAMLDPVVNRWDVAGMPTILSEAGGVFTDFTGAETVTTGTALATNASLQPVLLDLLKD